MKYIIGGVAFSGNKGASGMLTALRQNISAADKNADIAVMSYYPKSDADLADGMQILDGSPKAVLLRFLPALLCGIARKLHLPKIFWRHGIFKLLSETDYFLDAAGISFVDGREKFTVFNILTILPALCCGCKVIKVSQALGPFKHFSNRMMAKIILPRIDLIIARGKQTAEYLTGLKLNNVQQFSDVAFSMQCTDEDQAAADALLGDICRKKALIGISPSQVVFNLCRKSGKDYCSELEKTVRALAESGNMLVLFPHSARQFSAKTHNNDLPLLKNIAGRIGDLENVLVIDRELDAEVLRMLIGRMDILIASRFHAIVSAMAVGVPAVVIGWSHKYAEVLEPFNLDNFVMPYASFESGKVIAMAEELLRNRSEISSHINQCTADIRQDNQRFFERFKTN